MAVSAAELLSQTENAISGLLTALANANVQEYQMPDGRRVRRVEFSLALDALRRARTELKTEVAYATRSPIRVAKLGRPRTVDR